MVEMVGLLILEFMRILIKVVLLKRYGHLLKLVVIEIQRQKSNNYFLMKYLFQLRNQNALFSEYYISPPTPAISSSTVSSVPARPPPLRIKWEDATSA
jgi:predicted NAD/FAD-binding protein